MAAVPRIVFRHGNEPAMPLDWDMISEDLRLSLSRAAMRHASHVIAGQAEQLAGEMEAGALSDRGGPSALRLLAALVRIAHDEDCAHAGHA
jgi:hypothetical protein